MFDIAFSELVVIGVVALIVIGPEKLPKVARTVGLLLGRVQRYINGVKSDISRELRFEELQRLQQEVQQGIRQAESTIHQTGHDLEHEMQQLASVAPSPEPLEPALPESPKLEPAEFKPTQSEAINSEGINPEPVKSALPQPASAEPAVAVPQQSTLDLSFDASKATDHEEVQADTPKAQAISALDDHARAAIPSKQEKPD
ncbi:Sec-independent protein translocase protein TatB [Methylobacillus glycogenes]|uniref:Sec-independent protein translocase protein TatB n=1 Tax=Methylobacillus glycogenes TaxID=406 RepID=UPI00046F4BB6|nr:Sec-independent protein translocase protein TatB [Methylobacillus glycogenes]